MNSFQDDKSGRECFSANTEGYAPPVRCRAVEVLDAIYTKAHCAITHVWALVQHLYGCCGCLIGRL